MTNRTLRFYGKGFGSTPATMNVVMDGTTIFSGPITTVDEQFNTADVPGWPLSYYDVNFTAELPVLYAGLKPMTVTVTNGTIVVGVIQANYQSIPNPVFTTEEFNQLADINSSTAEERLAIRSAKAVPAFSQADLDIIAGSDLAAKQVVYVAHGVATYVGDPTLWDDTIGVGDSRVDTVLNGVSTTPGRWPGEDGTWAWILYSGDTLAYNMQVTAGFEP
jgi:hypothetical protein